MLLREVGEVAALANPAEPLSVSQRAFDRACVNSAEHAHLPAARQIARELKLKWPEVLAVAHAPEGKRNYLLNVKTRENAPIGWLTSARIRFALRLVAGRLGADSLTTIAYDAERDVILSEDARDWLHGRRLRIPSAGAIALAAHGWGAALRIAGLREHAPRKPTIHQVIVSRVDVMDRFYDQYGEQPSQPALKDFARGNKIPMSGEGGRVYSEAVAEWRQRWRDRGEPEPLRIDRRGTGEEAPDFSADVGAAKPGEYLHVGKWDDEGLCVEWVAYYLSSLAGGRRATASDYLAWALRNPGAPTPDVFAKHEGWSAVRLKADERLRAQGPPTGPPTPGPADITLSTTNDDADDADDAEGGDDGGQDHD
jgi:hypothetical protein